MLMRHTLLYMPAQLIGPLFQFVAAVAWTHWLSPGEYGVLAYVMAAQELAYLICLAWWSQYMLRYIGGFQGASERAVYQRSENSILAISAALQALVGVATLLSLHSAPGPWMVVATVVYCVSRSLTAHLSERARSAGSIATYTVAQVIGPVLGFGLALLAVTKVEANAEAALAGFALAQASGLVWLWRRLGLGIGLARPDSDIMRRSAAFGVPLVLAGVIGWISFNGIRVIVEQLDGPAAVGLISVGWGLGQRLAAVVAMLVTAAAFPLAVKYLQSGAREDALRQVSNSGAILFSLLAPACVGIVMISRPMVELLIAAPYQAVTYAVLPLAAVAGALRNLRVHTADQVIILFERTRLNVVVNVVEVIATVSCCILGLIYGGLPGATLGCLIGTIVGLFYGFHVAVTQFGLLLPWGPLARITGATFVMALVLVLIPFQSLGLGLTGQIIAEIVVGGVAYLAALLGLFPTAARAGVQKLSTLRSAAP